MQWKEARKTHCTLELKSPNSAIFYRTKNLVGSPTINVTCSRVPPPIQKKGRLSCQSSTTCLKKKCSTPQCLPANTTASVCHCTSAGIAPGFRDDELSCHSCWLATTVQHRCVCLLIQNH